MNRRLIRLLFLALAVAALATAGIVANFVLLGYADSRNDPVGKLNPRTILTEPIPRASTPTTADGQTNTEIEEDD